MLTQEALAWVEILGFGSISAHRKNISEKKQSNTILLITELYCEFIGTEFFKWIQEKNTLLYVSWLLFNMK